MASIGQLSAGVAHEINNPIGFILSNFGTLKEYLKPIMEILTLNGELIRSARSKEISHFQEVLGKIQMIHEKEDIPYIVKDITQQ